MILILTRNNDFSTNEVVDYLIHYKANFFRLNVDDLFEGLYDIYIDDKEIIIDGVNLNQINIIWLRRWLHYNSFKNQLFRELSSTVSDPNNLILLKRRLLSEVSKISGYIFHRLQDCNWLGDFSSMNLNRLVVSDVAKQCNLNVPKSYIINTKEGLLHVSKNVQLITKPCSEVLGFFENNNLYYSRTEMVDGNVINKLPDSFFPSLFQEYIDKDYELRVVFFNDIFYSMIIHSQIDEETKIDFRNYSDSKNTIKEPYTLNNQLKVKLRKLLNILELNFVSIDLLVKGYEIFFLEINPFGEFSMVSKPCNYFIEQKIAKYLIENDK